MCSKIEIVFHKSIKVFNEVFHNFPPINDIFDFDEKKKVKSHHSPKVAIKKWEKILKLELIQFFQ